MSSYITQYKSTIESLLKGKSKRVLLTDKEGYELVRNLFSHEEILHMEILGILMIDDPNLNNVDELFENEIVYFVGESSYIQVMRGFSKFKSNVYLVFYNNIPEHIIDEIISLDSKKRICEITHGSLNMNIISDNCVIGEDIWTVIKNNPKTIIYHKGCEDLSTHIASMLAVATEKSAIFERVGNNLLYVIDRSYDRTTPIVIPWRYESLRHFLKLACEGESPGTDQFYAKYRYTLYNEVIDESMKQSKNLTSLKNNGKMKDNVKEKFELDEKIRIISKHIEILGKIQTLVTKHNLLVRSQLEQKALIGTASSDELKELEKMNPKLYQMLVGTRSVTIKGTLNTFNMFNENTDKSIYHQYIPPIREILKSTKSFRQGFDNVYVYIRGYICYEEVAEVALFNKEYGSRIFLLSDQIKGNLRYPCITANKFSRCGEHFRICKKVLKSPTSVVQDVYYKDIEDKLTFLQQHNVSFDLEKERICESIKSELSTVLLKEFASLKTFKPENKLEENIKNIKMNRLSKLSIKFSEFEKTNKRIHNEDSCFNFSKETQKNKSSRDTGKQKLLQINDEEQELREMEKIIGERDDSVTTICQNIAEVHSMMLELNALVVKQGIMLESIDNNLINASDLIKDGNVQLIKADTHQKDANSLANKIIAGMVGLVILAGVGVGIKESIFHHH
jgi:hypothetical protein